ncbi:MAG: AraC family transcriptional regulator [Kiritimatiellia bacterium]
MNTSKLSDRARRAVVTEFRKQFGSAPRWVHPDGRMMDARTAPEAEALPALDRARAHALEESLRWGEPYSFFLAPGLVAWMVPGVQGEELRAGLTGTVRSDDDPATTEDAVNHLVALGAKSDAARRFAEGLPVWPQRRTQAAMTRLAELLYRVTGWKPARLERNRANAAQQRQIAEEIQRRKGSRDVGNALDEERRLLALIRAGDRKGARQSLNSILGNLFLVSPNPVVIKARVIEMLGYLVRAAVENSAHLEPLIEKNHRWTAALILTREFEDLTQVMVRALDDFMDHVYLMGYSAGNAAIRDALTYIGDHFREAVTLTDVARAAGLSASRIGHLIKSSTGHTFLQHVRRLRIEAARRRLEEGRLSCTEIGFGVGYNDQSCFIRHFRKLTGMTPGQYARGHALRSRRAE